MTRKHVVVTGGAGFLGSHLCERLIDDEHRVTCLDNFLMSTPENVAGLLSHREVRRPDTTRARELLDWELARLLSKDAITSPLRMPFTRYRDSGGPAEVGESRRSPDPTTCN